MYLKTNYKEINNVGDYVFKETEKLDLTLKEILKLTESVKECWQGSDSMNFINKASTYIKNRETNINELKNISYLIQKVSRAYENKDAEWEKKMREVTEMERREMEKGWNGDINA